MMAGVQQPLFEIKRASSFLGSRPHDGIQFWPDYTIIRQRTRGGDQRIPYSAITEVGVSKSQGEVFRRSLRIRTSHHTYIVRHLTKQEAEEAQRHILARMAPIAPTS